MSAFCCDKARRAASSTIVVLDANCPPPTSDKMGCTCDDPRITIPPCPICQRKLDCGAVAVGTKVVMRCRPSGCGWCGHYELAEGSPAGS